MPLSYTIDSKIKEHGVQRELGRRFLGTEQVIQFANRTDLLDGRNVRNELKKRASSSLIYEFDGSPNVSFSHKTTGSEKGLS
jgi:hypothetical protein